MIPASLAVLLLFLFILYQAVAGWLKQRAFTEELEKQAERYRLLEVRVSQAEENVYELDERTKAPKKTA